MNITKIDVPQMIQHLDENALITGTNVKMYTKYLKEYASAYANPEAALAIGDTLAYTVRGIEDLEDKSPDALSWGCTYLEPLTVDGEFTITRGHFHQDRNCPEYYLCASGTGYLIKWDGEDEVILEKMTRNSLHLIDGKYAHRMVNVGDTQMAVFACYPTKASQNYAAIEQKGFPIRLFSENGEVKIVEVNN